MNTRCHTATYENTFYCKRTHSIFMQNEHPLSHSNARACCQRGSSVRAQDLKSACVWGLKCVHLHMHACMHTCMHVHTHTHARTHGHTHTHVHKYTKARHAAPSMPTIEAYTRAAQEASCFGGAAPRGREGHVPSIPTCTQIQGILQRRLVWCP